MTRGAGTRCYGFRSEDGKWAHCTREEFAGDAPYNEKSGAYVHKRRGDCKCGVRHGDEELVATLTPNSTRSPKSAEPEPGEVSPASRKEETYYYPDAEGNEYLRVRRTREKDFYQEHYDHALRKWRSGLDGRQPVLYNLPALVDPARKDEPVFVVEGEKDADRLAADGLLATTNPMGAGKWRSSYADVLKERRVFVLPDNDNVGESHAATVAESVEGAVIARLPGLPFKGDVSDWLDRGGSRERLLKLAASAREEVRHRSRFEPVDLADAIENGVERQEELVPGVIYRALVTSIISAGGLGKTFMALWIIAQVIRRGENVVLIDKENTRRIIADRLRDLGVTADEVRKHLIYVPDSRPDLSGEALAEFEAMLERFDPALVVFDSWIGFLAAAGLDENVAVDITVWAEAYSQRARARGIAVLLIDHVPKEGGSARGSGRKLDYVDVQWELKNPRKFDRENVGRIDLRLKKDRLGWLPRGLIFNVGGGKDGFVFERNTTTFSSAEEETDLLPSDETTLEALRSLGSMGAFDKEWREEATSQGLSRATYYRSRETLLRLELVEQVMRKFFIKSPANPRSHEVSNESHETNETRRIGGVSLGLTPLKGETNETSTRSPS